MPQATAAPQAVEGFFDRHTQLEQQVGKLRADVARLEAQRPVMAKQLTEAADMFKPAYAQGLAQVDVQLAGAKAELASLESQLEKMSVPPTPPSPEVFTMQPPFMHDPSLLDRIDHNGITAVFVMLSTAIIVSASLAFMRRFVRRPATPPAMASDMIGARLDRVDQALDAIAIEVERVAESQRFMAKMLAEKPARPSHADVGGLEEGKPLLALGAGPIEPIRVAERQGVKQSITPH
jgi:hypothetical protein